MNKPPLPRLKIYIAFFLILSTLIIYGQVADHDFVNFDDHDYVTENPHVLSGLTFRNVTWAFTAGHASNWHPLTWVSHMVDVQLFGLRPGGHHLVNVLFHIANTVLLFLILNRMTHALWRSAFVAALFALHPLHVESVAWVSERKDVLSTFFWLLTLGAYAFYVEKPDLKRYLLTLAFFALGLMAKPMLVTLPFVLLLLDYWPLERLRIGIFQNQEKPAKIPAAKSKLKKNIGKKIPEHKESVGLMSSIIPLVREKMPFFILAAGSSVVTYLVQQKTGAMDQFIPVSTRLGNALISYAGYIEKMFWPHNLAVFYPHPVILPVWPILLSLILLAALTVASLWFVNKLPFLAVGWLWYIGTLVPVIGIVQVGPQAMADRYTYVPLIGLFIMAVWGIQDLFQKLKWPKVFAGSAAAVILSALAFCTWTQIRFWQNDFTLFQHALDATKVNYLAHFRLAQAYAQEKKYREAQWHLEEVLRTHPGLADVYNDLGIVLRSQGRFEEAIGQFREAIRIEPGSAEAHNNLAMALLLQGKIDEGVDHLRTSLRINPLDPEIYHRLGTALAKKGNMDEAVFYLREALRIKPDNAPAQNDLGIILAGQGKLDEAIAHFREALIISPELTSARDNLQAALAQRKKTK